MKTIGALFVAVSISSVTASLGVPVVNGEAVNLPCRCKQEIPPSVDEIRHVVMNKRQVARALRDISAITRSQETVNIMLNKKTVQSPTLSTAESEYAVDGDINTPSGSMNDASGVAFWQGDLQGYYNVFNITIVAFIPWNLYILSAIFGMSLDDVSCPNVEVVQCGQWPSYIPASPTQTYTCSYTGPIRFMKFTKPDGLGLAEVRVEGEPAVLNITKYDSVQSSKLTLPSASITADSYAHCGMQCHKTQPCIAFSYSRQEQPNCLLATDDTMTSDVSWRSYRARPCVSAQQCM